MPSRGPHELRGLPSRLLCFANFYKPMTSDLEKLSRLHAFSRICRWARQDPTWQCQASLRVRKEGRVKMHMGSHFLLPVTPCGVPVSCIRMLTVPPSFLGSSSGGPGSQSC